MTTSLVLAGLLFCAAILFYALRRGQAISFTWKVLGTALHIETKHRKRRP